MDRRITCFSNQPTPKRTIVIRHTAVALLLVFLPMTISCEGRASPGYFLEQFIIGLILGSVYALIALGYTLVYGVIKLINFAHGDIYMLGAFFGYYALRFTIRWLNFTMGVSLIVCFVISVVFTMVLCAIVAVIMERLAYRPLRRSTRIAALITAVGVSFLLENLGLIVFGANPKSYSPNTLEVYQVQVAEDEGFINPRLLELQDRTQVKFPTSALGEGRYARVRLVSRSGKSPWTPPIRLSQEKPRGIVEVPMDGEHDVPPPSVLTVNPETTKEGVTRLVLSWSTGNPEYIRVPYIFSGGDGKPLRFEFPMKTAGGANLSVPVFHVVIILTALTLLVLLNALINRSNYGIAMRALSFDQDAARLMGINVDRVIATTFAIGGASAAVAGNMVGLYNQSIEPLMGILPGIKAFVAAVVGGIGSVPGAAVGGLIMGLSEGFVKGYIAPALSPLADALAFAILIAVLLLKPSGLFGTGMVEKV